MSLIEQIRDKDFRYWKLSDSDTLAERFDDVQVNDWTICFNDHKYNPFSHRFDDSDKVKTFSLGTLYQVLDKKINNRGEMVIKIVNDLGKNVWTLTNRFAYGPELICNNMREEKLKWLLDENDVEL
jgi:hypothetical protein